MKIPEYSRQVKDAPLPGSRFSGGATAASFNGEAANIAKLGKAVDNVSLVLAKEALKKDKINATSSYNQARTDTDALLRGEGGIYNRKGLDAENSYGEFLKASEEINKKYSKDLKGQRAKGLFAANYADYITTNGKAVMTHESKERDAAQTIMRDADNNSWALLNESPSATNPVMSFQADTNTGIGRAGDDILSLIAGANEILRLTDTAATSTATFSTDNANVGACLKYEDNDGAGFTYCSFLDGVQTCSTTSCE